MRNPKLTLVVGALVVGLLLAVPSAAFADNGPNRGAGSNMPERHALPSHGNRRSCAAPQPNAAQCQAHMVTNTDNATPMATASYAYGFRPVDLQRAYNVPAASGAPTVAIVDAYNNPNAESDLAAYRTQFGLAACTTANGCFKKVNQSGGTTYPAANVGWGQEISLDVDMVAAVCPNCKILLVEANSNGFNDLMAAVDYAAAHAQYVSNSYGASEFSGEQNYDSHFNHPGVAITVSTGDAGYGVEYPAASKYVTAVGGTSLKLDANGNRTSETTWSGAGSGCSNYITKPTWQTDTGCARRTVADVSAVADPNTGVAIYDSYGSSGGSNWYVFGGTSAAAPIVAAMYAVAGAPAANTYPSSYPYATPSGLFDVTSGANGSCSIAYLCSALAGFDGPTGLGTPKGASAFAATGGGSTPPPPPPPPPPTNQAPVVDSKTKSCTAATCTFTVNAHDPEGAALTYKWNYGTSTTKSTSLKFSSAGTYTVTSNVSDGVNTVPASQAVSCVMSGSFFNRKLTCS